MNTFYSICSRCRYHERPGMLDADGVCVDVARCNYRISERARHRDMVADNRRRKSGRKGVSSAAVSPPPATPPSVAGGGQQLDFGDGDAA